MCPLYGLGVWYKVGDMDSGDGVGNGEAPPLPNSWGVGGPWNFLKKWGIKALFNTVHSYNAAQQTFAKDLIIYRFRKWEIAFREIVFSDLTKG